MIYFIIIITLIGGERVLLSKYKTHFDEYEIDISLTQNLSILQGDSGVGKSLIYNVLNRDFLHGVFKFKCYFINYNMLKCREIVNDILNSAVNSLIVIDNANILLDYSQRRFISSDGRNQYVIISHNTDGFLIKDIKSIVYARFKDGVIKVGR